ncbi:MAG: hypothetical protein IJI24_09140, partial [Lachnospiraceae bacterium]|nr:hypothetical protein [Lachnospiraceae bacterium]
YAMNADYFNSLPEEDQEAIRRAAKRSIEMQRPEAQRQNSNALTVMEEDGGVQVNYVDKTPFIEAADKMYENHPEYADLVEEIRAMDPAAEYYLKAGTGFCTGVKAGPIVSIGPAMRYRGHNL